MKPQQKKLTKQDKETLLVLVEGELRDNELLKQIDPNNTALQMLIQRAESELEELRQKLI